jgi:tRNA A-37 threonylcarbamoyl transferase component Bud32
MSWVPPIGSDFAGYRLEALLGHGGMSIVYRAKHSVLGRTAALKLLSPQLSEDEAFKTRFERESRVAASLDHPNIIPIFEASEFDGVYFIAMRYVNGSDLKTRLREGPLPPSTTISIIDQTANGLAAAHAQGLVHRDVKPANILIDPGAGRDESDHVYLSDFGVAKQTAAPGLTKMGMFVGTANYASPEQIEGRQLDARADVYSLGCVVYECLTGSTAFDKDSEVAQMYAHLLEPPPVVTDRRPDLPPGVNDVVLKAMAKSPDDRYGAAKELAAALRAALAGVPDDAVVPAGSETMLATAPPTAATAEVAEHGGGSDELPQPPAREGETGRPRVTGSRRALLIGALALLGAAVVGVGFGFLLFGGGDESGAGGSSPPPATPGATASTGSAGSAGRSETLLDVLVPSQIAEGCTTEPTPARPAVETEECLPPENASTAFPNQLTIDFFKNAGELELAYGNAKKGVTMGRCGVTPGERVWIHEETGKRGGRRFCYVDSDGKFVIVWTHEKLGSNDHVDMLAVAKEPGRSPTTFGWWDALNDSLGKCRPRVAEVTCFTTIQRMAG